MNITMNGEKKDVLKNITIKDLIIKENIESPDMVSVQLNGEFVDRENFPQTTLKNGDEIDFLYFMGGGQK